VTNSQLIEYMKNPVSASQIGSQPYMQCSQPAPPSNICNGVGLVGAETCSSPGSAFASCFGCPSTYPTLENPAPKAPKCTVPADCDSLWWDPNSCQCLCKSADCEYKDQARPVNLDPNAQETLKKQKNSARTLVLSALAIMLAA
jgi:hypothetical protein